jgi:hypothetical protein
MNSKPRAPAPFQAMLQSRFNRMLSLRHRALSSKSFHPLFWMVLIVVTALFWQFPHLKEIPESGGFKALIQISDSLCQQVEFEPGSHLEKKTLRPLVPAIIRVFQIQMPWAIYVTLGLVNTAFLWVVFKAVRQKTGDDGLSLLFVCALAFTYSGMNGWLDTKGWADAYPLFFLAMGLLVKNPLGQGICIFLALTGDERSMLAIPWIVGWHAREFATSRGDAWSARNILNSMKGPTLSMIGYLVFRLGLHHGLGFEGKWGLIGKTSLTLLHPDAIQMGVWSCFEACWILPILTIHALWTKGERGSSVIFSTVLIVSTCACFLVIDVTRSLCYLFPMLPLCVCILRDRWKDTAGSTSNLIQTVAWVCLLAPTMNFHGITSYYPALLTRLLAWPG